MVRSKFISLFLRRSRVSRMSSSPPPESLRPRYGSALRTFTASSNTFEVIDRLKTQSFDAQKDAEGAASQETSALYVLDSSFNPPTLAHLHIARSALISSSTAQPVQRSVKLLLLLATQNADKPSKPAPFEDRLVMMNLFGRDLLDSLRDTTTATRLDNNNTIPDVEIDIGLTALPYFIDKASSIALSNTYNPPDVQQTHLTGYDTLIRIFEPKYYPPAHTLDPLTPFLAKHRLRVTMRPDDDWGSVEEQMKFMEGLKAGALEGVGGKREWAERIEMVEGTNGDERTVSSTKARKLAAAGDGEGLGRFVTGRVRDYALDGALYAEG